MQEGTGLSYASGTASSAAGVISIDVVDSSDLVLAAWNGSSRCYMIAAQKSPGILTATYGTPNGADTYYGWYAATTKSACTTGSGVVKPTNWQNTGGFPN